MDFSADENGWGQQMGQGYEEEQAKARKTNILVLGNTGVGKSSFINTLTGKKVADVDTGKPVTKEIQGNL